MWKHLAVLAAASGLVACGVAGNGSPIVEGRNVSGFKRVENRTSLSAQITEGTDFAVSVKIDSNLQSMIRTALSGDTLLIDSLGDFQTTGEPAVYVMLPDFRAATASSSGPVSISGVVQAKELALDESGSGALTYAGPAASLVAQNSGSGGIQLSGSASSLRVILSGSGDVDASGMTATSAQLNISGSGSIRATLGGGSVSLAVSGSGNIEWWGDATVDGTTDTGSGTIVHH